MRSIWEFWKRLPLPIPGAGGDDSSGISTGNGLQPHPSQRENLAADMSVQTGIPFHVAASAEEVVRFADVLICATRSKSPVLEVGWVQLGTHVNTIGPKLKRMSEMPYELAQWSQVIATDSPEQVDSYTEPFFLLGTPERGQMLDLSEIVVGKQNGRSFPNDITLFCSVGLAGTEVVVANEALKLWQAGSQKKADKETGRGVGEVP